DADTSGVLLFAKSPGAVQSFSDMFESRRMEKIYLAVARGVPKQTEWTCRLKLAPNPGEIGKMKVDERHGKEAETHFRVISDECRVTGITSPVTRHTSPFSLIEARPVTGRTHQIRIHLAESGLPVAGDPLYGKPMN